jgi:lysyl-tRNA synthetase class I
MGWSSEWNLPPLKEFKTELPIQDIIEKVYLNKVPTHDPYSNPDAHIYYECSCGEILDPGTKSFASLNNHASKVGWKIRFSERGYIPHCVKCGEGIE